MYPVSKLIAAGITVHHDTGGLLFCVISAKLVGICIDHVQLY